MPQDDLLLQGLTPNSSRDPVWQRLWLRCAQQPWKSMALIGSSLRRPDKLIEVARGMAEIAGDVGQELAVVDARELSLRELGRMLSQVDSTVVRGRRCIVVAKLVTDNATTVPLAQQLDAALLCVMLGETSVVAASRTVSEIGREKFLGSVVVGLEH